ncbi:DUF1653 domain-containing protein [Legionella sp. WA2024007413]
MEMPFIGVEPMLTDPRIYGNYRHYKNQKLYEVIGQARHSQTREEMIVYKALYHWDRGLPSLGTT